MMSSLKSIRKNEKGFTLIEMIVVLFIVSLCVSFSAELQCLGSHDMDMHFDWFPVWHRTLVAVLVV